jgi:PEP-CTERM motif
MGDVVRRMTLGLLAAAMVAIGAPAAQAGVTCQWIPSMCPAPSGPGSGGGNSVPEPGTLALLALGAAASVGMIRRKKK